MSEITWETIDAIHSARKNYIQAENSQRIRQALKAPGQNVCWWSLREWRKRYFRKKNLKGWKGHVVVLEQDGQFELVRHGGSYFRAHPSNLLREKITPREERTWQWRHFKEEKIWPGQTLENTSFELWKIERTRSEHMQMKFGWMEKKSILGRKLKLIFLRKLIKRLERSCSSTIWPICIS